MSIIVKISIFHVNFLCLIGLSIRKKGSYKSYNPFWDEIGLATISNYQLFSYFERFVFLVRSLRDPLQRLVRLGICRGFIITSSSERVIVG